MRDDAAASYFHAIRMCRLKGLITGEFWPHEEDTFDLVMASAMTRENVVSTTILCDKSGGPGGAGNTSPDPDHQRLLWSNAND